jgi:hypothetical protein
VHLRTVARAELARARADAGSTSEVAPVVRTAKLIC